MCVCVCVCLCVCVSVCLSVCRAKSTVHYGPDCPEAPVNRSLSRQQSLGAAEHDTAGIMPSMPLTCVCLLVNIQNLLTVVQICTNASPASAGVSVGKGVSLAWVRVCGVCVCA